MKKSEAQNEIDLSYLERPYWTDREFAHFLSLHPNTVVKSRMNGVLLGRAAPEFIKFGKSVRYSKAIIEAWVAEPPNKSKNNHG